MATSAASDWSSVEEVRQAQTQFVGLTGFGKRRHSSSDSLGSASADTVRRTHWVRQAQTQFVGLTGTGLRRHSSSNSLPSRRGDLVELNLRRKILTRPRLSPACVMVPVIALANPEDRIRVAPAGTPAQHEASLDRVGIPLYILSSSSPAIRECRPGVAGSSPQGGYVMGIIGSKLQIRCQESYRPIMPIT